MYKSISIHALREEGDALALDGREILHISIHALREEGDTTPATSTPMARYFYPRPPRGGRPNTLTIGSEAWLFLSTPSARRATGDARQVCERDLISIHALREEGDSKNRDKISIFL
mgnify:CR=1 FL=1